MRSSNRDNAPIAEKGKAFVKTPTLRSEADNLKSFLTHVYFTSLKQIMGSKAPDDYSRGPTDVGKEVFALRCESF